MRLFISHTTKNDKKNGIKKAETGEDYAKQLTPELEKIGITPFVSGKHLKGGQDWRDKISDGIKAANAFLVIGKGDCKKSIYVNQEIGMACNRDIPIIWLKVEPNNNPCGFLETRHALTPEYPENFYSTAKEIKANIKFQYSEKKQKLQPAYLNYCNQILLIKIMQAKNVSQDHVVTDADAYAASAKMCPIFNRNFEEDGRDPFSLAYEIKREFVEKVTNYVDAIWLQNPEDPQLRFYALERKFGNRPHLIDIFRYCFLEGKFDGMYDTLLSDSPSQAKDITRPFKISDDLFISY